MKRDVLIRNSKLKKTRLTSNNNGQNKTPIYSISTYQLQHASIILKLGNQNLDFKSHDMCTHVKVQRNEKLMNGNFFFLRRGPAPFPLLRTEIQSITVKAAEMGEREGGWAWGTNERLIQTLQD